MRRRPRNTRPTNAAPNIPKVEGSGVSANCPKAVPKSPMVTLPSDGGPLERIAVISVNTATVEKYKELKMFAVVPEQLKELPHEKLLLSPATPAVTVYADVIVAKFAAAHPTVVVAPKQNF